MKKKIVFRLDCGKIIGSGHLMRCLSFARILEKINYEFVFVTYDFSKKLIEKVIKKEFKILYLNSKNTRDPEEFEKTIFNHKKNFILLKKNMNF